MKLYVYTPLLVGAVYVALAVLTTGLESIPSPSATPLVASFSPIATPTLKPGFSARYSEGSGVWNWEFAKQMTSCVELRFTDEAVQMEESVVVINLRTVRGTDCDKPDRVRAIRGKIAGESTNSFKVIIDQQLELDTAKLERPR